MKISDLLRSASAGNNLKVLTEDDYDALDKKQKKGWKGYKYVVNFRTYEVGDDGDAETTDDGEKEKGTAQSLEDLCHNVSDYSWIGWSSSMPRSKHDWIHDEPEQDYTDGTYTEHSLRIKRMDGKELDKDELNYLKKKFRL